MFLASIFLKRKKLFLVRGSHGKLSTGQDLAGRGIRLSSQTTPLLWVTIAHLAGLTLLAMFGIKKIGKKRS